MGFNQVGHNHRHDRSLLSNHRNSHPAHPEIISTTGLYNEIHKENGVPIGTVQPAWSVGGVDHASVDLFEDVEMLDAEEEYESCPGEDPDRHGPLRPRGEVELVGRAHRGEARHVDPIERHPQDATRRDPEYRRRVRAEALIHQQRHRNRRAQEDLEPEVRGVPGGCEEQPALPGGDDPGEPCATGGDPADRERQG